MTTPANATHAIIARLKKDASDSMTDYFASTTTREVLLAYSTHGKDTFSEMRKAAAKFAETAHLGPGRGEFTALVRIKTEINSNGSYYHAGEGSPWHTDLYGDGFTGGRNTGREFTTQAEAEAFLATAPKPEPIKFGDQLAEFEWTLSGGTREIEHREKYSMGAGFYLKSGYRHSDGWEVRKVDLAYLRNGYETLPETK